MRDMAAPCAHQARVHRERLDRDERRDVGPAFMADGQVGADRVQRGKGVQREASELDVGVEPVGERFRDALGEDFRGKRDARDNRDREDHDHRRNRRTDEPASTHTGSSARSVPAFAHLAFFVSFGPKASIRSPEHQWHPGCRHSHRSSICSPFRLQYSLQYLPHSPCFSTVQLQAGCAHLVASAIATSWGGIYASPKGTTRKIDTSAERTDGLVYTSSR